MEPASHCQCKTFDDPGNDIAHAQGIAKALTAACASYLKSIGCNRAVLHASPAGRPVYEQLGFTASNEMRLDLI